MTQTQQRVLGGIVGGAAGTVIYAVARLFITGVSFAGWGSLALLLLPGFLLGASIGLAFPKVATRMAQIVLACWP